MSRENIRTRSKGKEMQAVKEVVFILFTAVLVLVCVFLLTGTAKGQSKDALMVEEEYYQILEEGYVRRIRDCLEEKGFCNSGVTLTKTVEATGERSYEILIHHKRLFRLTEAQQERLFTEIEEMGFDAASCNFRVNLLS